MKRLVFCFDGTSNTLDTANPTNVAITASSVRNTANGVPQIVYYDEGVGTTKKDNVVGGAFGAGLYQNVTDAYKFLVFNYEPGDEVFIFGFSRGAYTARSFAGLIHNIGVVNSCYADKIAVATALYQQRKGAPASFFDQLRAFQQEFAPDTCANPEDLAWRKANLPDFDETKAPIVAIKYIGVWDTVKTLGSTVFGGDRNNDGEADDEEFHDHDLHASVESARHAVALDEHRGKFDVTLWDNVDALNKARGFAVNDPERPYQQVWFPGTHGSVGGGGDIRGLSDEGLEWVMQGAKKAGLRLDTSSISDIYGICPDVLVKIDNSSEVSWTPKAVFMRFLPPLIDRVGPSQIHEVSQSAIVRWGAPAEATPGNEQYRPKSLKRVAGEMDKAAEALEPWMYQVRGGYAHTGATLENVSAGGNTFLRHEIVAGESLEKIATEKLGDPARASEILAANPTTILDPDRYYAGQVINLPVT